MFTTGAFVAMAIGGSIGALLGFLFHALCAAAARPTPSPTSDAVKDLEEREVAANRRAEKEAKKREYAGCHIVYLEKGLKEYEDLIATMRQQIKALEERLLPHGPASRSASAARKKINL